MKRSQSIRLVFTGTLAGAVLSGCGSREDDGLRTNLSPGNTYTNNHYVPGAGYYHAGYHAWFPYPYNAYASGRGYYHGGQWSPTPEVSGLDASRPSPEAASAAQSQHDAARAKSGGARRGGFGGSSRSGIS